MDFQAGAIESGGRPEATVFSCQGMHVRSLAGGVFPACGTLFVVAGLCLGVIE